MLAKTKPLQTILLVMTQIPDQDSCTLWYRNLVEREYPLGYFSSVKIPHYFLDEVLKKH